MIRQKRPSFARSVTAFGFAILLVAVACSSPAPVFVDAEESASARQTAAAAAAPVPTQEVISLWVRSDGAVWLNGREQSVESLSEAIRPLMREGSIASIEAHERAPYGVVAAVQRELREAEQLRVVFTATSSDRPLPARDVDTLVDQGLPVVLPDLEMPGIPMTRDNVLHLRIRPSGEIDASRASSDERQRIASSEIEAAIRLSLLRQPNLIVVLWTHPNTDYRSMYEVLEGVQRAEATRFSLQLGD